MNRLWAVLLRRGGWVLVAWTIILWLSRLRNVLADDDLSDTGRNVRIGVVALFVALALAAAAGQLFRRPKAMIVLIFWTVVYWFVRGTGILIGDWSIGFKIVHTLLWVVSFGAAALAAYSLRGDRSVTLGGRWNARQD